MNELINLLDTKNRTFPIGLSGIPGLGYVLTGGISPLSRSKGLAVDQITKIEGIWGSGLPINLTCPIETTDIYKKAEWKALCGAAPFLGIITKIGLKTFPIKPLLIWDTFVTPSELAECIINSEDWPIEGSLQWFWGEKIRVLAIFEESNACAEKEILTLINKINTANKKKIKRISSINFLPSISNNQSICTKKERQHSEIIGILGKEWGNSSRKIVKLIDELIKKRPNKYCYIASQQLGGKVLEETRMESSFVHRDSMWKPWITGSWPAGELEKREESIKWIKESWEALEFICPHVHLAQIHNHLDWHQKEISAAFGDWLPKLKLIKHQKDPNKILPSL